MGHSAGEISGLGKSLEYVGDCTAAPGSTCKCSQGEKYMFLTGNSAGSTGYCEVKNQGTSTVEGSCDGASKAASRFSCFKESLPGPGGIAFSYWEIKNTNTVYRAETDGFAICYGYAANYIIKSDINNPPTTIRARTLSSGGAFSYWIFSPVKKGDYWKAEIGGNASPGGDTTIPVCNWLAISN